MRHCVECRKDLREVPTRNIKQTGLSVFCSLACQVKHMLTGVSVRPSTRLV
jgi:hypothetical protein